MKTLEKPGAILWVVGFILFVLSLSSTLLAQEPAPFSPLKEGIQHLLEGRLEEALQRFSEAASEDPSNPQPHFFSAIAYQRLRDFPRALEAIERALSLAPDEVGVYLRKGMILEEMGRFAEARQTYMAAIETPEGKSGEETEDIQRVRERIRNLTVREHFTRSRELYNERKYEAAVEELQIVLDLDPKNHVAYFALGMAFREMEKFKEAVDAFQKAVEIAPSYAEAYVQMGLIQVRMGAYAEAIPNLERFLSLSPGSRLEGDIRKALETSRKGIVFQKGLEAVSELIKQEKWEEALKGSVTLRESNPDHHYPLYYFGVIYHRQKRYKEALASLEEAKAKDPKFSLPYEEIGAVYEKMGRFSEALEEYEKAMGLSADAEIQKKLRERVDAIRAFLDVPELTQEAKRLIEAEDIKGAIAEVERLVTGRKKDPKVYLILGGLYLRVGDLESAASAMETAVTLDPKWGDARLRLGDIYEGLGRLPQAVESFRTAASLLGDTPSGQEALTRANFLETRIHFEAALKMRNAGDYAGALRETQSVLPLFPDDPVALFNAGVLLDLMDRSVEAESSLRRAIEVAPEYVQAHLQLGLFLERMRRFEEAEAEYRKTLEIQAEGEEARIAEERLKVVQEVAEFTRRLEKAISLLEQKKLNQALMEVEGALSVAPNNYVAHLYKGIIEMRGERNEEAIASFRRSVEINPNFFQSYLFLGEVLRRENRIREAREVYQKASELGKERREGEVAVRWLRQLRPWHGNFSLRHFYNTNISYGVRPDPQTSSNYSLSWTYLPIQKVKGGISMGISASQNIYYKTQLKDSGFSITVGGNYRHRPGQTSSVSLSRHQGYVKGRETSRTLSASLSLQLSSAGIPSSVGLGYNFSAPRSFQNRAGDTDRHNLSLSIGQNLGVQDNLSGVYTFSISQNKNLLGSNYGNRSNSLSLSFTTRRLPAQGVVILTYGIGFIQYMNPDSTTLFQQFRRNQTRNLSLNVGFPLSERVSFSLQYSYNDNRSNLPRATAELRQTLEEILATPIPLVGGDYEQRQVSISFGVRF